MPKESVFQRKLTLEIAKTFPGSILLKNNARYIQGFPDWLVLYEDRWAALECKKSAEASHRPNQDYYIETLDEMSYAAFVYPENEKEILDELQRALRLDREARLSKS